MKISTENTIGIATTWMKNPHAKQTNMSVHTHVSKHGVASETNIWTSEETRKQRIVSIKMNKNNVPLWAHNESCVHEPNSVHSFSMYLAAGIIRTEQCNTIYKR